MRRDDQLRKRNMPASVIADRCDLMLLRSAGQEDPLLFLTGAVRVSDEAPRGCEAEPAPEKPGLVADE